jgi:primosomal protein N' (replication factor Y) (superfamily II helicase)
VKPLSLKIEKIPPKLSLVEERPYVQVLVQLPFLAATEIYTYSLPTGSERVEIGTLVSVPLGNHETQGIVLSRFSEMPDSGPLKQIFKVLSEGPIITSDQIKVAQKLSERYLTTSWSFIRSMVPEYSIMGERNFHKVSSRDLPFIEKQTSSLPAPLLRRLREDSLVRDLLILPTRRSSYDILADLAIERCGRGKIVLVLPDVRDLVALGRILEDRGIPFGTLNSHQKKSERFSAYLEANFAEAGLFLTLRTGVFLHLRPTDTLIIFNEVEPHHYEQHSPTWNTRDVALSRDISVIFVSRSPSVEVVNAASQGKLTKYEFPQTPIKKMRFASEGPADRRDNEYFRIIRDGLKHGHVLVSVARSGYINGITCRKCRNIALCLCGGRLQITGPHSKPRCALCAKEFLSWKCAWCSGEEMAALSRGAQRSAAEFARAFPGIPVISSSGTDQRYELGDENTLVVATLGSEPIAEYSAIVVLDGQSAYGQVELRSQEVVRAHWFSLLSLLNENGEIFFDLPSHEEVSQGLLRSAAFDLAQREMFERVRLELPPASRILIVEGSFSSMALLSELLKGKKFSVFGLEASPAGKGRLIVKIPIDRNGQFLELLSSVIRIRMAKREEPLALRFDPFSMS